MHTRKYKRIHTYLIAGALLGTSQLVHAQSEIFADDFSVDSISYSSTSFSDSVGEAQAVGIPGAIEISLEGPADGPTSSFVFVQSPSDSLLVTAIIDGVTAETETQTNSANFRVDGRLYNDTGTQNFDGTGDVLINFGLNLSSDGNSSVSGCVTRQNESEEQEAVNLFDDGTNNCFEIPAAEVLEGVEYSLGYSLDREAGTIEFSFEDQSVTGIITTEIFPASSPFNGVASTRFGGAGNTTSRITSISTDFGVDNFDDGIPVLNRYNLFDNRDSQRQAMIMDGQLRLELDSQGGSLDLQDPTDYIEARLEVSGESMFDGQRQVQTGIELIAFNILQDGGIEGDTGEAVAQLRLRLEGNGRREAQYCLIYTDEFGENMGLLEDGEVCDSFPLAVEIDTPYRLAAALDRENSTMTFRVDGFTEVVELETGIFQARVPQSRVTVNTGGPAIAVVNVDDVRNSPDSLTNMEITQGLLAPEEFPAPIDLASLQVDSTVLDPFVITFPEPVDFVDDFSTDTSQLGFSSGSQRGDASVRYTNGALELQVNSTGVDSNEDNFAEFLVTDTSDSLTARLSLSSDSRLPADPEARSTTSISAVFHNDTQDGGFDNREGDIQVGLGMQLRGDGRRQINIDGRRRNADGSSESFRLFELEEFAPINNFIPELDTIYEFGVRLDRENGVIVYSINDINVEYLLDGVAFEPAQSRLVVQVFHQGESGVGIGHIHSIETDNFSSDFGLGVPPFAPYRPGFEEQAPGREREITDERLRLFADGNVASGDDPRLIVRGAADFVGATVELSSNSVASPEAVVDLDLGGTIYNDSPDNSTVSSLGDVYAVVRLTTDGVQPFVRACAFRSNDENFGDSTELLSGESNTGNCPRFLFVPELDVPYQVFVSLDREASTLTFGIEDETIVFAIPNEIFPLASPFLGTVLRPRNGSIGEAFIDDLAFSENPVPLAISSTALVIDDGTTFLDSNIVDSLALAVDDTPLDDSPADDTPTDDTPTDDTPVDDTPINETMSDDSLVTDTTFQDVSNLSGAVYSSSAIEIFWTSDSLGPFNITRDGEPVFTGAGRSFYESGLDDATLYNYVVSTADDTEQILLVTLPVYEGAGGVPLAPENPNAAVYSGTAIELFWTDAGGTPAAANYEIRRDGQIINTTDGNSFFEEGLIPGTSYIYEIITVGFEGQRSEPAIVTLTTNAGFDDSAVAPTPIEGGVTDFDTDTDADGIPDFQDVDQTGGLDANFDGVDDDLQDGIVDVPAGSPSPVVCSSEGTDIDSSTADWADNCELSDGGAHAVSSYSRGVQRVLTCLGHPLLDDGFFGPVTASAVTDFQAENAGLTVNGVVGPATWAALQGTLEAQNFVADTDAFSVAFYDPDGDGLDNRLPECIGTILFFQNVEDGVGTSWTQVEVPGGTAAVPFSIGF